MTSFTGTSDQRTADFDIAADALQWRVTASCSGSALSVSLEGDSAPLAQPTCPGKAFGFSIRTGPAVLDVEATGGWEVVVDQQLDTPVAEPPLAGMDETSRLVSGTFYGVDQAGSGTAALYVLPDGARALRLDPFQVTNNSDLFVWLSEADAPRTSKEALESPHVEIAAAHRHRRVAELPAAGRRGDRERDVRRHLVRTRAHRLRRSLARLTGRAAVVAFGLLASARGFRGPERRDERSPVWAP